MGKTNKEIEILQYIKDNLKNIKDNLQKNDKNNLQKNDINNIIDYIIFNKMFGKFYLDKRNGIDKRSGYTMYEMERGDGKYLQSLRSKDKDIEQKCNEIDKKTTEQIKLSVDIMNVVTDMAVYMR